MLWHPFAPALLLTNLFCSFQPISCSEACSARCLLNTWLHSRAPQRCTGAQVAAEQEAAREAGEADEGPLEVEGFLFKRLLERKPEKKQELLTLRDHLLASSSASDTLKVIVPALLSLHGCH